MSGVNYRLLSKIELVGICEEFDRELKEQRRLRAMAEANAARLKMNAMKPQIIPLGDEVDGYECPNVGCHAELSEDDTYCPGCGCEIDWRTWVDPEEPPTQMYDCARDRDFDQALGW